MRRSTFGDVALVVFLVAQVLDGALTYVGVQTFGLRAEGNPLLSWLMATMGHAEGILAAKLTAGVFGIALHVSTVHRAVALLAIFYVVVAVAPWTIILFALEG